MSLPCTFLEAAAELGVCEQMVLGRMDLHVQSSMAVEPKRSVATISIGDDLSCIASTARGSTSCWIATLI